MIKLIECPRDAMQGLEDFIPTNIKAQYINLLLEVGFDTIDFGSFVSPKAIPQMRDTLEVLEQLDLSKTNSKLLSIVANDRGIREAVKHSKITYIGFPFSISETFQKRNTNSSILQSISTVDDLVIQCNQMGKMPVVYLSMGFGNPYGDEWNEEIVMDYAGILAEKGVKTISLADTIGIATPLQIASLFLELSHNFPDIEFGVHLHSTPSSWQDKIQAAYNNGCKRFDSTIKGYGGCPMATDNLTGNIATENVVSFLNSNEEDLKLSMEKWKEAFDFSSNIFH
ncbi:MAG: hydroxymethylglutaryl-CoA lyase [Sphingobacteriales bacterium]|nr:hydroxymethylglutaryl-CoA lyase [Sphingobacteriales bacterium]